MKKRLCTLLLTLVLALCALLPGMALRAEAAEAADISTTRICGATDSETARLAADAMKAALGIKTFDTILYASAKNYADSLSSPYLAAQKNAPILLHTDDELAANVEYIRANLTEGGIVYILGVPAAVSDSAEGALTEAGITVERIAGMNRYQSNFGILETAGFSGGTVLVCPTMTFPEALSASATGLPVLLFPRPSYDPLVGYIYDERFWSQVNELEEFLNPYMGQCSFVIIGDESYESGVPPIAESILSVFGSVERLSGSTPCETSVLVAQKFFANADEILVADSQAFQGALCGAPLAYAKNTPLILTSAEDSAAAASYVQNAGIQNITILGNAVFNMVDPETCEHIPVTDPAVDPTCYSTGLTEGAHCSVCTKILTPQTVVPKLPHTEEIDKYIPYGCTTPGKTQGIHCAYCYTVIMGQIETKPLGHNFENGFCSRCNIPDPDAPAAPSTDTSVRYSGKERTATARLAANALMEELGVTRFDAIVYASGTGFADALAGSYLAAEKNAPILLNTDGGLTGNVDYIKETLAPGGIVYILGGTAAVSDDAANVLDAAGIRYERVKGRTRFQTNLEILKAGGFSGGKLLVCTAENFADSLSASATGLPILLVSKDWKDLSAEQKEYLSDKGSCEFIIIGGTGAVKAEMEDALSAYGSVKRVKGKTRYETSIEVAKEFFPAPSSAVLAYAQNYPDGLCGGALAYAMKSPLILTNTGATAVAEEYASIMGITSGAVLGGAKLIDDASVDAIFGAAESN